MTVATVRQQRVPALTAVAVLVAAAGGSTGAEERVAIPAAVAKVLTAGCLDCHSRDAAEASVSLDGADINWASATEGDLWRRVAEVVENRRMPPADADETSQVKNFRLLHTIEVTAESPVATTFTADLYEDETLLLRWTNAELTHECDEFAGLMEAWFQDDPRFLAAWQQAVFPDGKVVARPDTNRLRGRNGWDIVTRLMADPAIDLTEARMDSEKTRGLVAVCRSLKGTFEIADAMCHFYHDNGPALEIHGVTVEGPSQPVVSPRDKARQTARLAVTGTRREGQSDAEFVRAMLERFLPRAFRRPVAAETVDEFQAIAADHMAAGHSCDEALHLLLRSILVSPRFLYRDLEPADAAGRLDAFDLATRLSYFLTLGPPDERLFELAAGGRLLESDVLRAEAARLMPRRATDPMIGSFVGQWLDTRLLAGLMPDEKFQVSVEDIRLAGKETAWFFTEILRDNLPLATFIDPDFTWSSVKFCEEFYRVTPRYPPQPPVPLTVTPGVFTQDDAERAFFR